MAISVAIVMLGCGVVSALVWGYINFGGGMRRSLLFALPATSELTLNDRPAVAIVSPGRNEASHLPTTLASVCAQDYRDAHGNPATVVFVDDHSDDATPAITAQLAAQFTHLRVIRNGAPPPAGWVGKCWALQRGVEALDAACAARGEPVPELICFTDADIHWTPTLLGDAVAHLQATGGDVLALTPRLRFGTRLEAVVQLQLVLALGVLLPFEKAVDPRYPEVALTGGAFMLMKRANYDAVGGHEAVKGEVVDDLMLGRALKRVGSAMRVAIADDRLWCRMYEGWADMWEGLTKNAYAGLGYSPVKSVGLVIATWLLNVLPPVYAVGGLLWWFIAPPAGVAGWLVLAGGLMGLLASLLIARALNAVRKLMVLPGWYAWTMSVGSLVYTVYLVASMWRAYRGGNVWKGRAYGRPG